MELPIFAKFVWAPVLLALCSVQAQVVEIPDGGLETAIREELGKPAGAITVDEMGELTKLFACSRGIESIEGLEHAVNLTRLDLFENQLNSLTLPEDMSRLTWVDASFNKLTSVNLPDSLSNLEELHLGFNRLTGLELLAGLTSLTWLDLSFNQLTDLEVPGDMRSLRWLWLDENQLTRLSLPTGLSRLTVLILGDNPLTALAVPAGTSLQASSLRLSTPLDLLGINVTFYPNLRDPHHTQKGNEFTFHARAGNYKFQRSIDLKAWMDVGSKIISEEEAAANEFTHTGAVTFNDNQAEDLKSVFYRVAEVIE